MIGSDGLTRFERWWLGRRWRRRMRQQKRRMRQQMQRQHRRERR